MNISRRKFLVASSGLLVPAAYGVPPVLSRRILSKGLTLVAKDGYTQTYSDRFALGNTDGGYYAVRIVPTSSYTVSKLSVWIYKFNTPTQALDGCIILGTASSPGDVTVGSYYSINYSSATSAASSGAGDTVTTNKLSVYCSIPLTIGLNYWLVLRALPMNATHRFYWERPAQPGTSIQVARGTDGVNWTVSDNYTARCQLYAFQ